MTRPSPSTTAVVVVGLAFVVAIWSRVQLPFGDSHDGTNGAVWTAGGRAIIEDGPFRTHLGASPGIWSTYAHHPPGLYLDAALAYAIGRGNLVVARLPAVLSSLATIILVWSWLRTLGRSRLACFAGITCMVISPMFLLYGPMLNHEAVALPWACWALLILARVQRGDHQNRLLAGAVAAIGSLLAWQGLMIMGLVAATALVASWRPRHRNGRQVLLSVAAGAAFGLVVTVTFQVWAYSGFAEMVDVFRVRSGDGPSGHLGFFEAQLRFAYWGFPAWVLVLMAYGTVLVMTKRDVIASAAPLYGAVAGYALVFRDGAAVHSYWNFWAVVIAALGVAMVVDQHQLATPWMPRVLWLSSALVLIAFCLVFPTRGADDVVAGAQAGHVLIDTVIPTGQSAVLVYPRVDPSSFWITYQTRKPFTITDDLQVLSRAAEINPDAVVLVVERYLTGDDARLFDQLAPGALATSDHFETVRAADLVAALRADG